MELLVDVLNVINEVVSWVSFKLDMIEIYVSSLKLYDNINGR